MLEESVVPVQEPEAAPQMNGHVTPGNDASVQCNGVHVEDCPHDGDSATEIPPDSTPETLQDMPELISDDEDDNTPIQTFQTDQEWRQAIASFRVKGALSSRSTPFSPDSVLAFDQVAGGPGAGPYGVAYGQSAGDAAARERARKAAPTDKDWLRMMELEEQKKLEQEGKLTAEEISEKKAAAEAEAQRNLELLAEERRRLRAQQGLDGNNDDVILARCALRPGVAEDAVCEKSNDGFSIKGSEKYLKMVCTEGCTIHYHYACWRAFERGYKLQHPDFSWKSKDGVRCFTDGCTGDVKLALELQSDSGVEISRRELLRLPDEPKRAAPAAPPAEPKKARKQKGAQKLPAAEAEEPKARADRPTRQTLVERAPVLPAPVPKPEVKNEPAPPAALDFPEINFVQRRKDDDEDDLERLEKGLKGKKEKKKREKKGKGVVHVLPQPEAEHEDEHAQAHAHAEHPPANRSYAEHFGVVDDTAHVPAPALNSEEFPGLNNAAAAAPSAGPSAAPAPARPSIKRGPAWATILALKSEYARPHVLVQNVDMQSLKAKSKPPAAEMEKLLSRYGPFNALIVLPGLDAAAVSYVSTSDAEQAFFNLDEKMLEKKRLELSFLEHFPTRELISDVADESGTPALQKRAAAEQHFTETGAAGPSSSAQPDKDTPAANPKVTEADTLTMRGLNKGAALMGLVAAAEANRAKQLSVAAREFVPGGAAAPKPASQASETASGSRHASVDGTPAVAAGPSSSAAAEVEPDLSAITCVHLLGCDREVMAQYYQQQRFGFCLDDLADHSTADLHGVGLMLYDVDTHELHGLWHSKGATQSVAAGKVIAFEVLHKFPAINREAYASFLEMEPDGSLSHPQFITGDVARLCLQQFQPARASAPSPGRADIAARSISAAIKAAASPATAAAPLRLDVPPFEPVAAASASRPADLPSAIQNLAPSTSSVNAAAAVTAPPVQPAPAVQHAPAAQPLPAAQPAAPAAPAADPMASLFSNLFPKEAPAAAPPPAPAPAPVPVPAPAPAPAPVAAPVAAVPLTVQTAGAAGTGSVSSSASGTPRPSSSSARDPDRAARMAAFYGTAQASPKSRAQITKYLQSSGVNSRSSLDGSPRRPAAESTLAAAAQTLTAAALGAPGTGNAGAPVPAPAFVPEPAPEPVAAAQQPTQPAAPVAAKAPVRLLPPAGRPAYCPPTMPVRPYRPPNAPVAPQLAAALARPQPHQQQPQRAPQQPSFTEMLLSNIQRAPAAAARPAPAPQAKPPQPTPRPPTPAAQGPQAAADQSEKMSRTSSDASLTSDAASTGFSAKRSKPACALCQQNEANYMALPCKHWGPCTKCVPTATKLNLYPKCMVCQETNKMLLRVFQT